MGDLKKAEAVAAQTKPEQVSVILVDDMAKVDYPNGNRVVMSLEEFNKKFDLIESK